MTNFVSERRLLEGPWQAFERCIARMLEHGGFTDVKIVGGTGDQGADVVAMQGSNRWVFQAKHRASGSIGKAAVAETFKALNAYNADIGVTATNRYFSKEAKAYHESVHSLGFDIRLWNRDDLLGFSEDLNEESLARRTPRPYQDEAITAVLESINSDQPRGLVTLATGLGKTMVAATLIQKYLEDRPNSKVLVLAHMSDLIRQLDNACWPQFERHLDTHIWTDREYPAFFDGVTFATWQSVSLAMADGHDLEGMFDLVVVDECHHAPSDSFSKLLKDLKPRYLLGVTATPWRTDEVSLRPLFGEPLFSMNVVEGMQRGYLAKVDYQMLIDGIDWDEIAKRSKEGLTVKDLNQLLYVPERDLGMIEKVVKTIDEIDDARTLVFCRSIAHAERLLAHFNMYGVPAAILHSKLDRTERFAALSNFRTGKNNILISIEMLNEGIDVPEVNLVCFARVTHSRRIFLQQLGRGLRLSDGKSHVRVLDFVADVRRLAAGMEINREAERSGSAETVAYPDGHIVQFSSDTGTFFDEYLNDMANISDLDESARLAFPD